MIGDEGSSDLRGGMFWYSKQKGGENKEHGVLKSLSTLKQEEGCFFLFLL